MCAIHASAFGPFLLMERIIQSSRRGVGERHTRLDPVLEIQITLKIGGWPQIGHGNLSVAASQPVYPTEPLHQPHRVPVDIIIDHQVTALKVLAFGRQSVAMIMSISSFPLSTRWAFGAKRARISMKSEVPAVLRLPEPPVTRAI